jgi:hypothetical protein
METLMSDEVLTPENETEAPGYIAYIFTNDAKQAGNLHMMLEMFHNGVLNNSIGLMTAKHKETGEVSTLIVGVEHDGAETFTFPLARILGKGEAADYVGPDGQGGWLGEVEVDGTVN